ncbi:MAG TPA: hypothetical protein VLG69_04005 [Candidatus Andersenbacteria bacterium]|nr:hypothetical protein [Candidatus Andersenbacteria bacterium]
MSNSFGDLSMEEIAEAVRNMGGPKGVRQFLKGELVIRKFGDITPHGDEFPIFQTIKLGTFKTWDDMSKALVSGGHVCRVPLDITMEETEVDLVAVSVAELIKTERKRKALHHIYHGAKSKGLSLCHEEVAPQLCLQGDQDLLYREGDLHVSTKPFNVQNADHPDDRGWDCTGCIPIVVVGRHVTYTNLRTYPMHAKFLFTRPHKPT